MSKIKATGNSNSKTVLSGNSNTNGQAGSKNWFSKNGQSYASFRPKYPARLAEFLASLAKEKRVAVDVGCGSGQITGLLAQHFESVRAFDPSLEQIKYAESWPNIEYQCASAEALPLSPSCADLITVAQAAHWFDLPAFYSEVHRIAKPEAILALISYGVLSLEPELNACFQSFYRNDIYSFWPAARRLVDSGYADLDFPFKELETPVHKIELCWNLDQFLGYVSTWSAIRRAREMGQLAILDKFASDLRSLWGDPNTSRKVCWPINMRVGKI